MTEQNYTAFAAMLRAARPSLDILERNRIARAESFARYGLWCRIVQSTADVFTADNVTFDRLKFLHSAGLMEG